jgi:CheY-like chemotaxis protein
MNDTRSPVRVYLLDDHEVVRQGLRTLLESSGDIEVIGESALASRALDHHRTPGQEPDPGQVVHPAGVQLLSLHGRRLAAYERHHASSGGLAHGLGPLREAAQLVERLQPRLLEHQPASTLGGRDQPLGGQRREGLPHRAPGDAVATRELGLRRQARPRGALTAGHGGAEIGRDSLIAGTHV